MTVRWNTPACGWARPCFESREQLQDAVDIFGDMGELHDLFAQRHARAADDDEDTEEEDGEVAPEDEGDEVLDRPAKPKKKKKNRAGAAPGTATWQQRYERAHIARHVMDTRYEPSVLELHGILSRGE